MKALLQTNVDVDIHFLFSIAEKLYKVVPIVCECVCIHTYYVLLCIWERWFARIQVKMSECIIEEDAQSYEFIIEIPIFVIIVKSDSLIHR